jgi:DNA polymerase
MLIRYPDLKAEMDGYTYQSRKNRIKVYGGKSCENLTQALARIAVFDQMLEIAKKYRVVLTVHDEVVCCVPEEQVDECKAYMLKVMSTPPSWAPDLPMAAEAASGDNYGECK